VLLTCGTQIRGHLVFEPFRLMPRFVTQKHPV